MRDENIRLQSALDECNRRGPKVIERVIETVKVVGCDEWVVGFDFGKAELTNSAKFILDKVAENAVVDVIATASPEGTDEFNQKLSEQRAEVVAKYLTDRGVKVNGFVGKGVNPETGRAAVVKMAK
jgi:outer membrane protein OmpA-like peptidoglycan-associated protein